MNRRSNLANLLLFPIALQQVFAPVASAAVPADPTFSPESTERPSEQLNSMPALHDDLASVQTQLNKTGRSSITVPIKGRSRWEEPEAPVSKRISIIAKWHDEVVGFDLLYPLEWELDEDRSRPYRLWYAAVVFMRTGTESDGFLSRLAEFLSCELARTQFVDFGIAKATAINTDPNDIEFSRVRLKLFFQPTDVDDYGEIYLTLDVRAGLAVIEESETEFRPSILRALAE